MLNEEMKAIEEVARTSGKAIDLIKAAGDFLDDLFGQTLRQFGGIAADWARYFRYKNFLLITNKALDILQSRGLTGKPFPIPPQFALPILEGASLEGKEEIQNLWAGLIANAADPKCRLQIRKVFIEILRGLEPLDARIMENLIDPKIEETFSILTKTMLNATVLAARVGAPEDEVKLSLSTLARYGCILDAWENTLEGLDHGYAGFRVNNAKSNFRLSHLGLAVINATRHTQEETTYR